MEKLKALRNKEGSEDYEFIIIKGTDKECHALAKTEKLVSPEGENMIVTTFLEVSDMVTLQKALKRAEEGSRAKTAFLFNMSHDLRTPMNAIIGYSELMEKYWGEKEITTEYLHKLQEASGLLLELINNVLEMARIESGKEVLHEVPCNIVDLCSTLSSIVAMTANAFEEDRIAAFAAGMNEHIAKPIQIAKLMDIIGKMILA